MIRKWREKWRARQLQKHTQTVSNKYAIADNRVLAIEKLTQNGSVEAIYGLLGRFHFTLKDKSIQDQDEKEMVKKSVLSFGDRAVAPLKSFIQNATAIAWPLQILSTLIDEKAVVTFLLDLLQVDDLLFSERLLEKNIEILNHLREIKDPRIAKKVKLLLTKDHEDRIRFLAIDVLGAQGDELAREILIHRLLDDNETLRIKIKILETFVACHWTVKGYKKKVEKIIPPSFTMTKDGFIKMREVSHAYNDGTP